MNRKIPLNKLTSTLLLTLTVTGCVRFDNRTQAEGNFDYEKVVLNESYKSGDFSRDEERKTFQIAPLTEQQQALGLEGSAVDIRPPSQLIPVLDGVLLDVNPTETKVWLNAFSQDEQLEEKAWSVVTEFLNANDASSMVADKSTWSIDTGPVITQREYGSWSPNVIRNEGDYKLRFEKGENGRSLSLLVDVQSFEQKNNGAAVKQILEGRTKRDIEINFINDLLQFAYAKREAEALEALDNKPLPIKLGFDDNHQTAWIIDTEFLDAWRKLPDLLTLMSFKIVESDKNLGYFLVDFKSQGDEYWATNNLNPINLDTEEYFVQLGELTGGETSLVWLDADKKPLEDQVVTDLYLSITDNIRSVVLEKDVQTKPL